MYQGVVSKVLAKYKLDYNKVLPAQKGYRSESYPVQLITGELVNVIFYKRESDIVQRVERADAVSDYLNKNGLAVRVRREQRLLQLATKPPTVAGVYNYLPGHTIAWEAYTMEHIKLLGKTMSDVHDLLKDLSITLPSVNDEYTDLCKAMLKYFDDPNVAKAMQRKLAIKINSKVFEFLLGTLTKTENLPNQQPLHMDFVRGNVLFDTVDDKLIISGILDFEKCAYGHPLFDVARTLAFLLVDCKYKTPQQTRRYFLNSGYIKQGKANLQTVTFNYSNHTYDFLHVLTQMFLLHDFYKFLLHNPYEFLEQNEHFIRTRDLLVQNNMINYR